MKKIIEKKRKFKQKRDKIKRTKTQGNIRIKIWQRNVRPELENSKL
jgi:hypothetical protein